MPDAERNLNYFGLPVEKYPEACQSCTALAELALLLENPDLTEQPYYLPPGTKRNRQIARMVFPYLDQCSATCCGLRNAYAVQFPRSSQ